MSMVKFFNAIKDNCDENYESFRSRIKKMSVNERSRVSEMMYAIDCCGGSQYDLFKFVCPTFHETYGLDCYKLYDQHRQFFEDFSKPPRIAPQGNGVQIDNTISVKPKSDGNDPLLWWKEKETQKKVVKAQEPENQTLKAEKVLKKSTKMRDYLILSMILRS